MNAPFVLFEARTEFLFCSVDSQSKNSPAVNYPAFVYPEIRRDDSCVDNPQKVSRSKTSAAQKLNCFPLIYFFV